MRALLLLFLLTLPGIVYANSTLWECRPHYKIICSAQKCREVKDLRFSIKIDLGKSTYSRCDSKGCSDYPLKTVASGIYTIYFAGDTSTYTRMLKNGESFSEAAGIGPAIVNSFGKCTAK